MARSKPATVVRGVVAVCFAIAGILMAISSKQKCSDWTGFTPLIFANFLFSLYNAVIAICIPSECKIWKPILFFDVLICILMGTSLGVEWQTYLLFVEGNKKIYANWDPVLCGSGKLVPDFCIKILVSFIFSSIGSVLSYGFLCRCLTYSIDVFIRE